MVAQRVGRDRTFITNYLRLLRLPVEIQQLLESEKLSMGHARALLGIDDPDVQRSLAKKIIEKGYSVRETERAIKKIISGVKPELANVSDNLQEDANLKSAEVKLQRRLSSKVQIVVNQTGGGKVEIKFYDQRDLNRIYDIIMGKEAIQDQT
jgi:ParB family chromosome partitioning protein